MATGIFAEDGPDLEWGGLTPHLAALLQVRASLLHDPGAWHFDVHTGGGHALQCCISDPQLIAITCTAVTCHLTRHGPDTGSASTPTLSWSFLAQFTR